MSFSGDVKEELVHVLPGEAHCRLAELAALLKLYAKVEKAPNLRVLLSTDNPAALRKCFTLLNKTFNIRSDAFSGDFDKPKFMIELNAENSDIEKVFERLDIDDPMPMLKKDCCKRAYLRGAFLATGFINDPNKGYHFELLSTDEEYTKLLTYLLSQFNITPKRVVRKKYYVTYLKEYEGVLDTLSIMGAGKSMMDMANVKIMRGVKNTVTRRYNCEVANLNKSADATSKQIEDILLISDTVGLDALPDTLKEMANVRMDNPGSSYTELGSFLNPPVGKSGVNHRLRKISEFAEDLRKERDKT